MSRMSRSKYWVFTAYDPDDPADWWERSETSYICWGEEICPSTGRKHYQGYMEFDKRMRFNQLRTLIEEVTGGTRIHLAARRGTAQQARDYCEKVDAKSKAEGLAPNEVFVEHGEISKSQQGQRSDLLAAAEMVKENKTMREIAEALPVVYLKFSRGLQNMQQLLTPQCNWEKEVIVFWGESGSGKTRKAVELAQGRSYAFVELQNGGFICGYAGEEVAILDDFEDGMCTRQCILRLLDRYPYKANVKGGYVEWAPRTVVITTNFDPRLMFGGDAAWLRRISRIEHVQLDNGSCSEGEPGVGEVPNVPVIEVNMGSYAHEEDVQMRNYGMEGEPIWKSMLYGASGIFAGEG